MKKNDLTKTNFLPSTRLVKNNGFINDKIKHTANALCLTSQVLLLSFAGFSSVHARGAVTTVHTENITATPFVYTKSGYTYRWG